MDTGPVFLIRVTLGLSRDGPSREVGVRYLSLTAGGRENSSLQYRFLNLTMLYLMRNFGTVALFDNVSWIWTIALVRIDRSLSM